MIPFLASTSCAGFASLPPLRVVGELADFPVVAGGIAAVVVVCALAGLATWVVRLQARLVRLEDKLLSAPAPAPRAPVAVDRPAPAAAPGLAPDVFAAIAIVVHVALAGEPHRIHAIAPVGVTADWAREGRRIIFASHRPH
ncbi:MAG TPA: hypothetical protein VG710_10825 [Opitutus sp.]|nr:hypothetical protein [Opitutus sp.]